MRTITNNYSDFEIIDLDPTKGSQGPFIVLQSGLKPNSEDINIRTYILRQNGNWIDVCYYLTHKNPDALDEAVFDSLEQIIKLLDTSTLVPQVIETEIDDRKIAQWFKFHSADEIKEWAKNWVQGYRVRTKIKEN